MKFEWDSNKAAFNLEKHGISFSEAETVFDDPFFLTFPTRCIQSAKCVI
jgi:uncharacterized DUF497 family protein